MERFTKIVVLAWTCAALALETWLLSSSWSNLPLITISVAAAMAVLSRYSRQAVVLVLAVSYLFPALVVTRHGGAHYAPHEALWMAALVGSMLPEAIRTPWHIPAAWRPALVTALLVVVMTSPIVILREIDFNPGLLTDRLAWSWGGATWPFIVVTWILHVSLTLVVGVIWFDWLFGARDLNFQAVVVTPLVLSAFVLTGVSIYQLVFDVGFLNGTVFAVLGRASGTMYDANVSGTIAALWMGGAFIWSRRLWPTRSLPAALCVIGTWLAVWATGSRTAFAAAGVVTIFIVVSLLKESPASRLRLSGVAAVVLAVLVALVGAAGMMNRRNASVLDRVWTTLPAASVESAQAFAAEMWNRNGYGASATAMLRQTPVFGIGVGTYHTFANDYLPGGLPPDNAQNWIRHQIVEFGVLGSLGWLVWFVSFGVFLVRGHRSDSPDTWVTRGVLIAFALISMVGMPGQDVMVAVTFWTMAFWHLSQAVRRTPAATPAALPRWMWAGVVVVALAAAAGTTELALTRLRVPVRALATSWPYSYGFSTPEPVGAEAGYRQTRAHAVAVLDVRDRWLSVSVRLARAVEQPIDVRVWTNDGTLLKGQLSSTVPLTAILQLPDAQTRVLLEAAARRVGSRRPFFLRASEPVFLVKWEFLDREPPNINGYSRPISS